MSRAALSMRCIWRPDLEGLKVRLLEALVVLVQVCMSTSPKGALRLGCMHTARQLGIYSVQIGWSVHTSNICGAHLASWRATRPLAPKYLEAEAKTGESLWQAATISGCRPGSRFMMCYKMIDNVQQP